jgi:serralysin
MRSFPRTFAVALALLLTPGLVPAALANSTDVALEEGSSESPTESATATAKIVLAIINAARAEEGCGPLKLNSKLMAAAKTHANNMAVKNFFGHSNKDGSKFSGRVKKQGYKYRMVAENIAAGQSSAKQVAYDWLGSSGHRKNIMTCKLKDTGIAVAYQADDEPILGNSKPFYYYWVQVFAAP